jgi:hypothetical protein
MPRTSKLSVALCLLTVATLLLASCGSAIVKRRYVEMAETEQKWWTKTYPPEQTFVYHFEEYEFQMRFGEPHMLRMGFLFLLIPFLEQGDDRLTLALSVHQQSKENPLENAKEVSSSLISLSNPFFQLKIGHREISPKGSGWLAGWDGRTYAYTSKYDSSEFPGWTGQNLTVHFSELHIRNSATGDSKRVLLPPLQIVTGKTVRAKIGSFGHSAESHIGWVLIAMTIALYAFLIWFIVRIIRRIVRKP